MFICIYLHKTVHKILSICYATYLPLCRTNQTMAKYKPTKTVNDLKNKNADLVTLTITVTDSNRTKLLIHRTVYIIN